MARYSNISIERGTAILEALGEADIPLTLTAIAGRTLLNRPTTFRLLAVLQRLGYVQKSPRSGRYSLGHKVYGLGRTAQGINNLVQDAAQFVRRLAHHLDMTTFVASLQGVQVILHDKIETPNGINLHTSIGMRVDAHAISSGKVLLASRPDDEIRELYRFHPLYRHTGRTITSISGLLTELDRIRRQGYAIDSGELNSGVESLSVVVESTIDSALIAVSTTGNVSGMTAGAFRSRLMAMQNMASQIYLFRVEGKETGF